MKSSKEKRPVVYYQAPSPRWVRSRNPIGEKEIKAWYARESKVLKDRLSRAIFRKYECFTIEADKETGKPLRKSKVAKEHKIYCWKISEQDYRVYKRFLDQEYQRKMEKRNGLNNSNNSNLSNSSNLNRI